jgi:WD40 repeat protein
MHGPDSAVTTVAFSPDGRWVLTGSVDGTARLWLVQLNDLMALACSTAVRNLTWEEWQQYFPEQEYHATCPNLPDHFSFIAHLVQQGADLAEQGKVTQALAAYNDVRERYPTYQIDSVSWDTLCRYGGLWAQANNVLDACERAVEQAPSNGSIRDSRGLARALTGDSDGAIEDFNAFIAWTQKQDGNKQDIAEREAWIAALEAGRNPFDSATLERLRGE